MSTKVDEDVSILFCKHTDIAFVKGDITLHICQAINELHPNEALDAQKIRGTWIIAVRNPLVRESLLSTNINVNGKELKLYDINPYDIKATRVEGERVTFKDLPLWESSSLITEYLSQQTHLGPCSKYMRPGFVTMRIMNSHIFLMAIVLFSQKSTPNTPFPTNVY